MPSWTDARQSRVAPAWAAAARNAVKDDDLTRFAVAGRCADVARIQCCALASKPQPGRRARRGGVGRASTRRARDIGGRRCKCDPVATAHHDRGGDGRSPTVHAPAIATSGEPASAAGGGAGARPATDRDHGVNVTAWTAYGSAHPSLLAPTGLHTREVPNPPLMVSRGASAVPGRTPACLRSPVANLASSAPAVLDLLAHPAPAAAS